jgi:rubrerythrin
MNRATKHNLILNSFFLFLFIHMFLLSFNLLLYESHKLFIMMKDCVSVKYFICLLLYNMSSSTELTDTAYDILKVLGKDADFLYDTIETYIKDAQKANKSDLVEIWQTIKKDRQKHMHMLREALEKEIHG